MQYLSVPKDLFSEELYCSKEWTFFPLVMSTLKNLFNVYTTLSFVRDEDKE